MTNLIKPYEIAIYDDKIGENGNFQEERICIIGSDQMTFQGRALEPELVRSANGQTKLTFKMYKRYIDITNGEEFENPFIQYLISERKVKLKYGKDETGKDIWYDFIVKDINENSSTYLYTYQLEDATVQELSKNGFGITLDTALMNNIGNSQVLGEAIMAETDWRVEAEKIVETIEEALVYVTLPEGQLAWHIMDQAMDQNENYSSGITIESEQINLGGKTVLAFYSSCKNKPHRFQFIYSPKSYNIKADEHVDRQDDRLLNEKDCQYYIEYDNPEDAYSVINTTFDFFLPSGFQIVSAPLNDTTISSNYRGKRYAFAQQAIYIPTLDKYCSRFQKTDSLIEVNSELYYSGSDTNGITFDGDTGVYTKVSENSGIKLTIPGDYKNGETYKLSYVLTLKDGILENIGGHSSSFLTNFQVDNYGSTKNDTYTFSTPVEEVDKTFKVTAYYLKKKNDNDSYPYLFIQPNKGLKTEIQFTITDIELTSSVEYLSYVDTEYVSPALVQNYINNYKFDSTSGWIITGSSRVTLGKEPTITNCYGRFENGVFYSMIDDFINGQYSEDKTYTPYMQVTFTAPNQFVLNSGLRDNRTVIGNLEEGTELIADCKIINSSFETQDLPISLGEYIYNQNSGGYNERTGLISFAEEDQNGKTIFKVVDTSYTKKTFKKNSKLYLKIAGPQTLELDSNSNYVPQTYYIEKISLYKKVLGADGEIIVPDYDAQNSIAAQEYVDNSVLKKTYSYFPKWIIDYNLVNTIEEIPLKTFEVLTYDTYKPIYNDGAEKIRTISVKESNYFNNLQVVAETFEQWLVFEITRNDDGSIIDKKVCFKNYRGKDNYACFRYGVNLQDIQRTYTSKNIVTKLIVKNNSNEHAEDGLCTIQRAGANPTGENYIYDFQYYQNQDIMPVEDYLNEAYYMNEDSQGPDQKFWGDSMTYSTTEEMTLKGYFPRLKKLNEKILPLGKTLAEKKIDLLSYQSEEEIAKSTYDAALSGIETTREDFKALTGVFPEEIQDDKLKSINIISATPQDSWYEIGKEGITINGNEITVPIKALASNSEVYPTPQFTQGISLEPVISPWVYKLTKGTEWEGIYLEFDYCKDTEYILEYDLTLNTTKIVGSSSSLINIGCHNNGAFVASHEDSEDDTSAELPFMTVTRLSNNKTVSMNIGEMVLSIEDLLDEGETALPRGDISSSLHVTLQGQYAGNGITPYFWIQPNRGITTPVTCTISNIRMYVRNGASPIAEYSRKAYVDLIVGTTLNSEEGSEVTGPNRKYTLEIPVPIGQETATATQIVTVVDRERSDVRKYFEEYTVYHEKIKSSTADKARLATNITTLNTTINTLEAQQKDYLKWKQKLNQLFFKKYARFIQEGTWINEEYVDDNKYYADAQSVLYNSCYPQVAYTINVLELSQLPGYELFVFNVGDKTWVIDDEFFGNNCKEEVIVTEIAERLDDPSKNRIKVQNFKNQFQDLFQKITATVQQTQYSAGAYEKGAALVEANEEKKSEFITKAINSAASFLAPGKSHTVTWEGGQGITVTDDTTPTNQVRIVGGAILFSAEDPRTKEQTWITGVTNQGISANLITAGRLDTGSIQIMSGTEPVFRWDAYGISAYDAVWHDEGTMRTISGINSKKFVRFDKNGIYGINSDALDEVVDGSNWHPNSINDIDNKATFALTWDGLKVTGNEGVIARLGKVIEDDGTQTILSITQGSGEDKQSLMMFSNDGTLKIGEWIVTQKGLQNGGLPPSIRAMKSKEATPEVFLMATPVIRGTHEFTGISGSIDNIVFKAGENFMVSEDGTLYAKDGIIGDMEIGDIASKNEVPPKDNLIRNTNFDEGEDGFDFWTKSTVGDPQATLSITKLPSVDANSNIIQISAYGYGSNSYKGINNMYLPTKRAFKVGEIITGSCECRLLLNSWNVQVEFIESGDYNSIRTTEIHIEYQQSGQILEEVFKGEVGTFTKTLISETEPYVSKLIRFKDGEHPGEDEMGINEEGYWGPSANYNINSYAVTVTPIEAADPYFQFKHQRQSTALASSKKMSLSTDWQKLQFTYTITEEDINSTTDTSDFYVFAYIVQNGTAQFRNLKLEYGNSATAWVPSSSDKTIASNINTNNFSWRFSPTEGMFMWDGAQGSITADNPTGDAIFAIYQDGNNKKLYVKGHIVATSLDLGSNKISTDNISGLSNVATTGDYKDLSNAPTSVSDLGFDTSNVVYKGDIKSEQKTDAKGRKYTLTTLPDGSTTTTYDAGEYMLFGSSQGTNSGNNKYICIEKGGLLTARNAWIHGTIYATDGEFTGNVTATSGKIGGFSLTNKAYESTMGPTYDTQTTNPGLLCIANRLETPYEQQYNGSSFGSIQIISRQMENNTIKSFYSTYMTSVGFGVNDGSCSTSIGSNEIRIGPNKLECISISRMTGRNAYVISAIGSEHTYIEDKNALSIQSKGICLSINGQNEDIIEDDIVFRLSGNRSVQISDLVFKGPYYIMRSSSDTTVVGRIYTMGTLVYGYFDTENKQDFGAASYVFSSSSSSYSSISIPGPYKNQTFQTVYKGGDGHIWVRETRLTKNSSGNLQIELGTEGTTGHNNIAGNYNGNPDDIWHGTKPTPKPTYFIYSTNTAYSMQ